MFDHANLINDLIIGWCLALSYFFNIAKGGSQINVIFIHENRIIFSIYYYAIYYRNTIKKNKLNMPNHIAKGIFIKKLIFNLLFVVHT